MAFVGRLERARDRLPEQLEGQVTKPVLLSMLREVLRDSSPAVRAEALTSLQHAHLDDSILMLLGPAISDPHPLVRFRIAELLASSQKGGGKRVMDHLANDPDELVQKLVSSFQETR